MKFRVSFENYISFVLQKWMFYFYSDMLKTATQSFPEPVQTFDYAHGSRRAVASDNQSPGKNIGSLLSFILVKVNWMI